MTNCQVCEAKSALYLCNNHIRDLGDLLTALATGGTNTVRVQEGKTAAGGGWWVEVDHPMPGLIEHLTDAAVGQVRLGDSGRRGPRHETPMKGNPKASTLLTDTRLTINHWVLMSAPMIGIAYSSLDMSDLAGKAMWLSHNATKLAGSAMAGELHGDIKQLVDKIERTVNRPIPPKLWGRCTTRIDDEDCATAIYGQRDAIEVTCPNPKCKTTYNAESLFIANINASGYMHFTREELIGNQRTQQSERYWHGMMGELGEFVHYKQFQRWVKDGVLKAHRWRRPNGRHSFARRGDDDIPEYLLSDVRRVRRMCTREGRKMDA